MRVVCPHCRIELSGPDHAAGTTIACRHCRGRFELPAPARPRGPSRLAGFVLSTCWGLLALWVLAWSYVLFETVRTPGASAVQVAAGAALVAAAVVCGYVGVRSVEGVMLSGRRGAAG
jgi:hypothetical protein